MKKRSFAIVLAMLLVITLVAPTAFFIAPQRASASAAGCIGGLLGGLFGTAMGALGGATNVPTISNSSDTINSQTAGVTTGSCINDLIIVPAARAAIRGILQGMTASVLSWINGANGTGQPSYVQNLSVHLQGVGDSQALPFIDQSATAFNSPFGPAISSSLRANYDQETSMSGFYAANQCTLSQSSPNVSAYLDGDWSKGGISEWFALTTQKQNNPYTLYQTAANQLDSNVSEAQANRRQDLLQSQGFQSWCGPSDTAGSVGGVNPGTPCTNSDGTPDQILTPGSIIHDYTQKAVVASGFDQLTSATEMDDALGALVTAVFTQALGGEGGLLGGSTPSSGGSGGRGSLITQLQHYSPSSVTAGQSAFQTAGDVLTRVAAYTSSANTITAAANAALASATSLSVLCTASAHTVAADVSLSSNANASAFVTANLAQASAAQTAISTEVTPVLTQVQAALGSLSATKSLALQVQREAVNTGFSGALLGSDVSTLAGMPPSAIDLADVQSAASVTGGAAASPSGSLTVSRGSLVDQMNLISSNAQALKASVCTIPASFALPATRGW